MKTFYSFLEALNYDWETRPRFYCTMHTASIFRYCLGLLFSSRLLAVNRISKIQRCIAVTPCKKRLNSGVKSSRLVTELGQFHERHSLFTKT